jgi:hypothetical protein
MSDEMLLNAVKKQVLALIAKAECASKADDALKFSQAACNAADALCSLKHLEVKT